MVYPDSTRTIPVSISKKNTSVDLAIGLSKPNAIIYNSNAFGYGVFPVNTSDLDIIPNLEEEVARAYAYLNTYENTLTGNLSAEQTFALLIAGVLNEENEFVHGMLTGLAKNLYWSFLNDQQRAEHNNLIKALKTRNAQFCPDYSIGLWPFPKLFRTACAHTMPRTWPSRKNHPG